MKLKRISKHLIHDGKVVMVALAMEDTNTGEYFSAVGRATCDLSCDEFDLVIGDSLATERAFVKIAKKSLRSYNRYIAQMNKEIASALDIANELQAVLDVHALRNSGLDELEDCAE